MKLKNRVELISRYGDKNYLVLVSKRPVVYKLILTSEYYRIGTNDDGSYHFIDPSGGPFISVDEELDELKGYLIKSIKREDNELLITFKKK